MPRLAFGCATVGMSVVPLILASSACSNSAAPIGIDPASTDDAGFTGILPYTPLDASPDADAAFTGILPYIPDAGSDANAGDAHDEGDAATDAGGD